MFILWFQWHQGWNSTQENTSPTLASVRQQVVFSLILFSRCPAERSGSEREIKAVLNHQSLSAGLLTFDPSFQPQGLALQQSRSSQWETDCHRQTRCRTTGLAGSIGWGGRSLLGSAHPSGASQTAIHHQSTK